MQRPTDGTAPGGIDPREIITPDSFSVAPDLIGLPLARPLRRGAAMLLDFVPLALLVNANAVFFAMAAAVLLWRASSGTATAAGQRRRGRRLLRVPAVILTFVVVLNVIDDVEDRFSPRRTDAPVAPAPPGETAASDVEPASPRRSRNDQERERPSVLALLGGIADDLGIGFGWMALYFTAFLALGNGQTPGKRLLGIQVIRLDGKPIGWWIAFERFGGYAASIWTGLLGFLQIFWDRNRQGIHDKIVETVVIRVHRQRFQPRR